MKICYVHGAGASERSFVWLQRQLPKHEAKFFTYSIKDSLASCVVELSKFVKENETNVIVGHSLGGVMAHACSDIPNIQKIVTLCAPFGGLKHADYMYMFSAEQIFSDMRTYGPVLTSIRSKLVSKPHLAIVGTKSLPFTSEANDGVVTVASQTFLFGPQYELLTSNHFEVLLSTEVATKIATFMKD